MDTQGCRMTAKKVSARVYAEFSCNKPAVGVDLPNAGLATKKRASPHTLIRQHKNPVRPRALDAGKFWRTGYQKLAGKL